MKDIFSNSNLDEDEFDVNHIVDEFRSDRPKEEDVTIVPPLDAGAADALASVPKYAKKSEKAGAEAAMSAASDNLIEDDVSTGTPLDAAVSHAVKKKSLFMRFFGALVPHVGDGAFDVIRKCVMIAGILVFIGAATYLVDDLVLIPMQNTVLASSLQSQYDPNAEPQLNSEELNYVYPDGIDPSFKKLYYQNHDIRGWLSFHSSDGSTVNIDYPVMQSTDNDFYLYHDYHRTYNKNGSLFFDYRNDFSNKTASNQNAIIYGHNMASGQMFAGLNNFLDGVDYARTAPTFTMNTIYKKGEYKVFAVMVVNNSSADGVPFNYLRTDFADNVDFSAFLSEILARSLYVYGDVDLLPTDEIVTLSTCSEYGDVYFNDGRTVVVARRVRENESAATDVSKITVNDDVIMPYAWYVNQGMTPHAYYLDANYVIQPLDSLMAYIATSTNTGNNSTTALTIYQSGGTFGLLSSHISTSTTAMMTMPSAFTFTTYSGPPTTAPVRILSIDISSSSRTEYTVGDSFDYAKTYIYANYSDGSRRPINSNYCAITGFDSSRPCTVLVTVHYGAVRDTFFVKVKAAPTTDPVTTPTTDPTQETTATEETGIPTYSTGGQTDPTDPESLSE
ncbi:MAG: sortase domain-bontaining protein [Acutalibacteraceae bacterium]